MATPPASEQVFSLGGGGRSALWPGFSRSYRCQRRGSYPQIFVSYPVLCTTLWITSGQSLTSERPNRYFHCVETPKPAAMKPKPTTMFQLLMDLIGSVPSVT